MATKSKSRKNRKAKVEEPMPTFKKSTRIMGFVAIVGVFALVVSLLAMGGFGAMS